MRATGRIVAAVALAAGLGGCRQVLGFEDAVLETCKPGATQACEGAGTQTCKDDGTGWEACVIPPGSAVWSAIYGDAGGSKLAGLGVDAEGNIYLGGEFQGTIAFGGLELTAGGGSSEVFLAKLRPDGTGLWARKIAGASGIERLTVDPSGRVTISGALFTPLDFGCGTLMAKTFDQYVAQLDSAGTCSWSRSYDGTNSPQLYVSALGIDPKSGDVLVAGSFNGSADLGAGTFTTLGMSDVDIFVARLRSGPAAMGGGTTEWAMQLGGTAPGTRSVAAIAADAQGYIHFVGQLAGDLSTQFGGITSTAAVASSNHDALYGTLIPNGNQFNSSASAFGGGTDQSPNSLVIDPTGKSLFAGYITGSVDFGDATLTTSGPDVANSFLAKFSSTYIVYSRAWGGALSQATSIASDEGSNMILAGVMTGTVNFGGMDLPNLGQSAAYLVKLDPSAKHLWSKGFGDTTTAVKSLPVVVVDPTTQQVILAFGLEGSVDLGNGKLTAAPGTDNFVIAKLSP